MYASRASSSSWSATSSGWASVRARSSTSVAAATSPARPARARARRGRWRGTCGPPGTRSPRSAPAAAARARRGRPRATARRAEAAAHQRGVHGPGLVQEPRLLLGRRLELLVGHGSREVVVPRPHGRDRRVEERAPAGTRSEVFPQPLELIDVRAFEHRRDHQLRHDLPLGSGRAGAPHRVVWPAGTPRARRRPARLPRRERHAPARSAPRRGRLRL